MDWILGCFKCGKRRPTGNSVSRTTSGKDGCAVSSNAALLGANSAQTKESSEVERVFSVEGDGLKRNSSAHSKSDRRTYSSRRSSSEQLLLVEKLEEEIDSLNKQLMEEATQATSLTNEVRHLRKCSALLDSPNAFKKALNALEQALEKGELEESQPLLYLHTLLSKIESSEEEDENSPERGDEERQAKGFANVSSLATENDRKSLETAQDKPLQVEPGHSQQVNFFIPAPIPREPDERQSLMLKNEQTTYKTRPQHLSDVEGINPNKTEQILVVRRRSSKTLSFSGFLLVEDVVEERPPISEKVTAVEPFSSTELARTKIIEKTHLSDENLLEASKSLFAFSTDSSQGHSTLSGQSISGNISKDISFPNSDSEDDACSVKPEGYGGFFNLQYRPSGSVSTGPCPIDANEFNHSRFSEADEFSLLSTCCSNSMDYIGLNSLDSEASESRHGIPMHNSIVKDKIFGERKSNSSITCDEDDSVYRTSHTTAPCLLSQGEFSLSSGEAIVELSSPETTSFWNPDTQASPYAVHTLSPQRVDRIKGWPSGFLSETPSTPTSVISYESRLHLAGADASKLTFTPLRTPLASHTQAATPSTSQSQGSPSSLGEDRPILGTHWNPSSLSSSTQKWWDGKGIPNSTNKYKEDQKVSWHATPFEVRLERALAKQGRVFQKKLFTGAMATEMEAGM